MKKLKRLFPVIFITSAMLWMAHGDILANLNSTFFRDYGDGFKNYYNHAYHLKHDSSYLYFEGMNYPVGEVLPFVDIHPLFTTVNKFIANNIWDEIGLYTVGIINGLLLLSIVFCSMFMYLILRHYDFDPLISALTATGVALLSSTVLMWNVGHYALGHASFFPIGWYLLLRYRNGKRSIFWSILIAMNLLFWSFTHLYLGAILFGFSLLFWLSNLSLEKDREWSTNALSFSLQFLFPLLLIVTFYKFMDVIGGRIELPYQTSYKAEWSSLFLSKHSILRPIHELFFDVKEIIDGTWSEIGNYVGLSTTLLLLSSILILVLKFLKKDTIAKISQSMWVSLAAAYLLFLFAMAFPFKYDLDFLLPSFLKQFMGMGRFAWAFYFVLIVFSMTFFRSMVRPKIAKVILLFSASLLIFEGFSIHSSVNKTFVKEANYLNEKSIKDIKNRYGEAIKFNNYQVIIPIPFYHGYLTLHNYRDSEKIKNFSMQLSFSTGLPLMSAMLSRPSLVESRKVLEFLMPPYYKKSLEKDMTEKPLLIIGDRGVYSVEEEQILKNATLLYADKEFEFYELQSKYLFNYNSSDYLSNFLDSPMNYNFHEDLNLYSNAKNIEYKSFDHLKSVKTFRGLGALQKKKSDFNIIYSGKGKYFQPEVEHEVSFWYYNHNYDQTFNSVWYEIKDSLNRLVHSKTFDPAKFNVYEESWALNKFNFTFENEGDYLVICSQGGKQFDPNVYFDELLIRPLEQDVYQPKYDSNLFIIGVIKNNEYILITDYKK